MADNEVERTFARPRAPTPVGGADLTDRRHFLVVVDGAEPGRRVLLGDGPGSLSALFADLLARYNDGTRFVLHFSTPWEMYRAVRVLEANDRDAIEAIERFQYRF